MSVPTIGRLTVVLLLSLLLPAPSVAQARGAVRGSGATTGSRAANSFTAGRVAGTTVDRQPAPASAGRRDRGRSPARWYRPRVSSGFRYGTVPVSTVGNFDARPGSGYEGSQADYSRQDTAEPADFTENTERVALPWKPGGIFAADGSPLAGTATAASAGSGVVAPADAGLALAVHRVRIPRASRNGTARLGDIAPVIVWEDVRCAAQDQESPRTRKLPRVIGWLYRWVRGYDLEESSTPAPLLYMRSPLLAGLNEPVGCPRDAVREYRAPTCVAVTASDGREHIATYFVPLQLGATTPAELAETVRQRLKEGEHVFLRTVGGGVVELDPAKGKDISVQKCDPED